ncbi:hypothetical protein [Propionicicella superfundia]|uniref:hypothetical protein n=1 Tax=Propionicicella superfundia TaxID=348582 RepID=UPI0004224B2D|nr:hypothetical protein [Propionicicella superfundia]
MLVVAAVLLGIAALLLSALDARLTPRHYAVATPKVASPVRLMLLTDLHSEQFGPGQQRVLAAVAPQRPDAVLLGGDIYDDVTPRDGARTFVTAVAGQSIREGWPVTTLPFSVWL